MTQRKRKRQPEGSPVGGQYAEENRGRGGDLESTQPWYTQAGGIPEGEPDTSRWEGKYRLDTWETKHGKFSVTHDHSTGTSHVRQTMWHGLSPDPFTVPKIVTFHGDGSVFCEDFDYGHSEKTSQTRHTAEGSVTRGKIYRQYCFGPGRTLTSAHGADIVIHGQPHRWAQQEGGGYTLVARTPHTPTGQWFETPGTLPDRPHDRQHEMHGNVRRSWNIGDDQRFTAVIDKETGHVSQTIWFNPPDPENIPKKRTFAPDGTVLSEVTYHQGRRETRLFHNNGNLERREVAIHDLIFSAQEYDENGTLLWEGVISDHPQANRETRNYRTNTVEYFNIFVDDNGEFVRETVDA